MNESDPMGKTVGEEPMVLRLHIILKEFRAKWLVEN